MVANSITTGEAHYAPSTNIIRLRGEDPSRKGLTPAQCRFYKDNGYLVLPDTLTPEEAATLLDEAHDTMKHIAAGGDGVIMHNTSGREDKLPSPVGRILATFEGQ